MALEDDVQAQPYPWAACLARFGTRLLIGAVVWIVLLVLLVMSAVPYGSSSAGPSRAFVAVSLLIALWALAGLLPPLDTWGRTISWGRIAAHATLPLAIAGIAVTGLFMLVSPD